MTYRILLILAAAIWGFAFVAQVVGLRTADPLTFNGLRFFIGAAVLIPLIIFLPQERSSKKSHCPIWLAILLLGFFLFGGSSFQQIALQYTTASKAGFLTSTYLLIVPILSLFTGKPLSAYHIIGSFLAMSGVYCLSVTDELSMGYGDQLILFCAVCFSCQILLLDRFTQIYSPLILSAGQFFVAGTISLLWASTSEALTLPQTLLDWWPMLYTGILSTGVAYTLQAVGQKHVPPTEASMLLSLEMIFSALSGMIFLSESFTDKQLLGAFIMCIGVFLAQIPGRSLLQFPRTQKTSK